MTRSLTTRPGHARRWHRARAIATLAVPVAVAAGVLPAAGTAAAQPAAPTSAGGPAGSAGSADQQHSQPLSLPGLHDSSYSVTLLTGDQVRLTAAGGGHYSVVATPKAGSATVTIDTTGGPDGVKTMQATPAAAQLLVATGQVDRGLFDVQYLASHGYTDNAGKAIPVTVQYADHADADTMTRRAGSLPASTVAATDTRTATADLRVDAHHVADFWAALTDTGATATTSMPPSRLAGGVAHVWLTGHRTFDQQTAQPDAETGQPTYPVTLTLTLRPSDLGGNIEGCNGGSVMICGVGPVRMWAVGGDNALQEYLAIAECLDEDPCTTVRARFDVPAGTYIAEAAPWFFKGAQAQLAWAVTPQLEVNGPRDVTLDLSRLQHVDITTPRPTEAYEGTVQWNRTLPDGRYTNSITFSFYGWHSIWALPTDQPVTIGSFNFSTAWVLGAPPVTAHVDGPKGSDLHPMYPSYYYTAHDHHFVRFDGRQRLQVVDAGDGAPEDFAAIDARGKLAFVRAVNCRMSKAQLDSAIRAGAVGVLLDPRIPIGVCGLPISYQPESDPNETPPDLPFAALPLSDAIRLRGLLEHGDVRVTITDSGPSPYTYNLKFYEEGDIPGSLRYDIDNDQLTAVDARLHADTPTDFVGQITAAFRPNEFVVGGVPNALEWPARRTEHYGPVSPDLVYSREWDVPGKPDFESVDVFDQRGGHRTEDINARPASPGPFNYHAKVPAAQPPDRFSQPCAMCRQGNALAPFLDLGQGSRPMSAVALLDPGSTHLYLGDEEIPQTSASSGFPAYILPPERHTYRMVTDYDNRDFGHTHTDWRFTSTAPDRNRIPTGTHCFGDPDEPCRPDPMVFLSYDLGVDLNNHLAAPGGYGFSVAASHQAADAPAIRDLKLWTSIDDGRTWKPALVQPTDRGADGARGFSVITAVPPLNQTTGTLSIKAQATDADGNSITQTLTQAVRLTQDSGWRWPGHRIWE